MAKQQKQCESDSDVLKCMALELLEQIHKWGKSRKLRGTPEEVFDEVFG